MSINKLGDCHKKENCVKKENLIKEANYFRKNIISIYNMKNKVLNLK